MRRSTFVWCWTFGNVVWFVLVPVAMTVLVARDVDAQWRAGLRTSGQGDWLSLPFFLFVLLNGAFMLFINVLLGVGLLVRRTRAKRRPLDSSRREYPDTVRPE
jgi:hypothetical protein